MQLISLVKYQIDGSGKLAPRAFIRRILLQQRSCRSKLEYCHVSRRIERVNKRLKHRTGELLFEKRGHRWALTGFGFEVWGKIAEEVKEDEAEDAEGGENLGLVSAKHGQNLLIK